MKEKIISRLSPSYPWKEFFHFFSTIDSTNDRAKQLARQGAPHGTVLLANHQTGGHGRLGRSFQSPEDVGIYMTVILRPNCLPREIMHLTCAAAVAMCDAVEKSTGFRPGIKWTNDLVFEKRKLGGILTELGFTKDGLVDYAIVGIGINCCQKLEDFHPEIRSMAGSLSMVTGGAISRGSVAAAMMEALASMSANLLSEKSVIMHRYRQDCVTLGQQVSIVRGSEVSHGLALDIDEDGALLIQNSDGSQGLVSSGEVSIRGMYGYL